MKKKSTLLLLMLAGMCSTAIAAGINVCLTNSFGEQASLVATAAGAGKYNITGQYDYRPFGSTLWPVHGTYNGSTRKLHFVAVNPNPDNCTQFADSVIFDYTVSGANNINGSFSNNCGNAGALSASAVRGSCGFAPVKMKQGEYGGTGSHSMQRTQVPLPRGEDLQKILGGNNSDVVQAGIPVCLTNSFGEQASLVATAAGAGKYNITGQYDYRPFGSTLWPVHGTYNGSTRKLHFVAVNPNPDNCTQFADSVIFDYTVSGANNINGSFSNNCGNAGALSASAARGSCGFAPVKMKQGEYGGTGSHSMQRTQVPLPQGEDLQKILGENNSDVVQAGIPVCLTNSFGEQASLVATAAGAGKYNITGQYDYRPFGSTLWPVHGTYNGSTRKLHFVAVNPNPDNCTQFADSVIFDYTVSGANNINGSFSNNCGNAGALSASAARGSCGFAPVKMKQGESGGTGSSKMHRTQLALPQGEDLQKILMPEIFAQNNAEVQGQGIQVCIIDDFGEEASLRATQQTGTTWALVGTIDYRPFGSTLWDVKGVYDSKTQQMRLVAKNPNPDFCTSFADKVIFNYDVSGRNLSGTFWNDCGNQGPLGASASKGSCGYGPHKIKDGEYGSTGAHKMLRSHGTLPAGEELDKILAERIITVSPNPAIQSTQISFTLNFKSNVTVQIYDQFGNLSRTLVKDVSLNDGKHTYTWNLRTDKGYTAQRGAYWIKVITNDGVMTQRLVVMY